MFTATANLPLATTVTGSLPRPAWYTANLRGRAFAVAMADLTFREQYVDAVGAFISDQSRSGLDILTDGDSRFDQDVAGRAWFSYVTERMRGLSDFDISVQPVASNRDKQPGDILFEVMETRVPPTVTGKVSRGHLDYVRLWKTAQRMTAKPVKFGSISAQLVEAVVVNRHYQNRRDLVIDLSAALNAEYHELADAGCPIIQVEEPCIHETVGIIDDPVMTPDFYVEAFNREVQGLRAKTEVWCHVCWGSPAAQRVEHRRHSYAASLPYLARLNVDVLTFEAADNNGADLKVIADRVPRDKKICIGVVSHRVLQVERPDDVAALIRTALEFIEPQRLLLSTDCGFGRQGMSRMHAFYKMVSIVRGANIVRKELGLPEARVLAADPDYSLLPTLRA